MQNSCATSNNMWNVRQNESFNTDPAMLVTGYTASVTTCLDYVTDEISVSGLYFLMSFAQTMTVTSNTFSTNVTAVTAATTQTPLLSIKTTSGGTGPLANQTVQYIPVAKPLDTPATVTIATYGWNFGVAKQVVAVRGTNYVSGADKKLSCLVLFSAPE